jgi:hypothetical protein
MQQAGGKPRRSNATDRKNAPLQKINWCSGLNGVKSRERSCVAILRAQWIQGVHGMEVNPAGKVPLRLTVEEAPDAPRGSSLTGQAARHLEYPRRPRCARSYVEAVATSDIEAS